MQRTSLCLFLPQYNNGSPIPEIPKAYAIARLLLLREASPGATVIVSVELAMEPALTVMEAGFKAQVIPILEVPQ